ncbi:immunoglobulin superfamily member 10 [Bombina bombina]|uniref:immunoglobulin superfamily member 10 n=1 Tax=Bombina bombina TaxID=8345 RepID=UPI00235A909A|nr:immunoglobulin superfamily member 10 [Bombina bombina]XP_053566018.1 immunoglobulin superfamily member 10 [Bombina bombina]
MMMVIGRRQKCFLGLFISFWFAALPNSSKACPKPCACYVSTEVHCTFRYLTVIPRQIQADVERINLGYNSLNKLGENDLSGLRRLELLMLHSNEIQTIHENAFKDLSSLQVLKMSYNKVKTLHKNTFHSLKNMVRLHMDHNKLEFLNPESFYGLTSLKLVHLEGNLLRQLHTDTFVTLRYIQIFKTSSIKHIYLSDNQLSSLPKEMFLYLTELEGIYLHGNPWSCECNLQWLTELPQQSRDMIKCKRDRAGIQCPMCAAPRKNKGKSLTEMLSDQLACEKPTIENIFKNKNVTNAEEGGFTAISSRDFVAPIGSLILNMTDQAGNEANLDCIVQRPTKMSPVTLDTKTEYTIMRTTFSSFLVCNLDYDYIQKLWGILAMYSDSPMKLKRDLLLTKTPYISYKYKQFISDDEVFTDIEAELRTEPSWLMQDVMTLQLDRTATTLNLLHIKYLVDVYVTIPNVVEWPLKNNWVMIMKTNQTKTEYSAVIGGTIEMDCHVMGEPAPAIEWVLPDGSKIKAPYISEEGRITITSNGKFILKAADRFDTGIYHCIGTNYIDADAISFRITVVSADVVEDDVNGAEFSVTNGEVLYLPCGSNGIPDASVSWILPDHSVIQKTLKNKQIFTNGTLKLEYITSSDSGHFRCIAANRFGLDILIFKVLVKEKTVKILDKKSLLDHHEGENQEGSGTEKEMEEDSKYSATGKAIEHKKIPIRNKYHGISPKHYGKFQGRNKVNKRIRGHRRQFKQNTRIDPQRWTEILEKTKQNINTQTQEIESSVKVENDEGRVSGEVEEPSGEGLLPVDEPFLILTTKYPTLKTQTDFTTANYINNFDSPSVWTTKTYGREKESVLMENKEMFTNSPKTSTLSDNIMKTSKPYFDTDTQSTTLDISFQPTTHSFLKSKPIEVITTPPTLSEASHVTTNSILPSTPNLLYVKPKDVINDLTTIHSLTIVPPNNINNPPTTNNYLSTIPEDITIPSTTSSYSQDTSPPSISEPLTISDTMQVTSHEIFQIQSTTSSDLNISSQEVLTNPQFEFSKFTTLPQNAINPTTTSTALSITPEISFSDQPTTSSHLNMASQNFVSKHLIQSYDMFSSSEDLTFRNPTTYSPLNVTVKEILTKAPVKPEDRTTNTPTDPNQFLRADMLKSKTYINTQNSVTSQPNIFSTSPFSTSSYVLRIPQTDFVQPLTKSQSATTPKHITVDDKHFFQSQNQKNLNTMVPGFSETSEEVENTNIIATDSSTKSSAKILISQTEIGPIYFHSTQKIISPQLPAGSTIITHQHIQILKDVTPFMPTIRRYGRRRISGRRRIIRPNRIPNIRDHRFKFVKTDVREKDQAITTQARISSKQILHSTSPPTTTSIPLLNEHTTYISRQTTYPKWSTTQQSKTIYDIDNTTVSSYISSTQHSTQNILKIKTEHISILNTSLQASTFEKINTTAQIPITTLLPDREEEKYSFSTSAPPTTKPRTASKILRRKIPWHRIFGSNQILQREILRKLRKTTSPTPAISSSIPTTSIPSKITKPSTSLLTHTEMPNETSTEPTTPLVITESMLRSTVYLADIINQTVSMEDITILPSKDLSSTATPMSFISTDMAVKQKQLKRKRLRNKNVFPTSVFLNKMSSINNTSTVAQSNIKIFNYMTTIASPAQSTMSHTISEVPNLLTEKVTKKQTVLQTTANNILLPTKKDNVLVKTTNTAKKSSQPINEMKSIPKQYTYSESMDKTYITTTGPTITKESNFKERITEKHHTIKTTPSYTSDIFTSSPALTKYREVNFPPALTTRSTKLNSVNVEKMFVPNLKNKNKTKTLGVTEKSITTTGLSDVKSQLHNMHSKPRIVGGKAASFTVLANSDAFIPCNAIGTPSPTILWTKVSSGTFLSKVRRGNKMEVFINGTLSIPSVSLEDRGQYLCVASNQHGSDRLLVTLSVITYPPRILQGRYKEITVHSGSSVNVKCQAEGRPFPTITWILANNGTIASETTVNNLRVFMQSNGTLTIKSTTIYDRGIYKCIATNQAGDDTLTVKIQVIAAPPFIVEEKRETLHATPGQNLKIPCTVKGNPHPSIYWVAFDGTKVKPLHYVNAKLFLFSNGTLFIRNVASSDSGHYECIATSSTGSERRVVNLVVQSSDTIPKIINASPKTTEMSFGGKLMLNCTATGEPKPRILWRLPSKAVVDQWHRMGSRIQVYPNGSLVVESVNEKDAGDYLCVARNKMGDDLILMKVSVTMKPAKIIQKHQLIKEVPYGKEFKVDCKVSGSPIPEVSWSLPDGTLINNVLQADDSGRRKRRYILFDNGTLYLNKVGINEGGDYICYAENTLGKDEMKVHITVVTAAPRITLNQKTHFKARAGQTAVLDCEANGEPKPKMFWLLPSSDMIATSHERYVLHDNGSLSVSQVKLLDAGEYMCVARNPAGDDTKLLKLEVLSNPPLINGLYSNRTVITDTAIKHSRKLINCKAEGSPPLQVMWIMPDNIYLTAPYHGSRIIVHMNGTLEIRNVRPSDTAEFTCVARNDGGESMLVVQLEVIDMLRRPMFKNPFNEKIIAKPGKMAILNCFADGNPAPEILWLLPNGTRFLNGQKYSKYHTGSNGTFIIYSPTKDDAGKYRCAARNKVGYIEKLIILEVGQKPTILTHPRGPIKSIIGETLALHCLSDGIPRPRVIWTLPSGYMIDRPHVNGKYMLFENGTLVVQDTTIHDRGNYLCKVMNNAGEAAISVPVMIVAYPPRITNKPPQSLHTRVGSAVHLNCMAIGIPKPEISWELPDLSVLSTASKGRPTGTELLHPQGTLVVQNPQSSDSGMYKCIAKNSLGTDTSTTYLRVI